MVDDFESIQQFLDEKVLQFNQPKFIEDDPIQIPHLFSQKEDIEIAAFLTATIAWGKRQMIIKNSLKIVDLLDQQPYDFIINHSETDLKPLSSFVHRTFNGVDLSYFIKSLKHIYTKYGGLEQVFSKYADEEGYQNAIHQFKQHFFELPHPLRTTKHVSDPRKGSAAKRINMFLRWMVRKDQAGVDFGIWNSLSPALLSCPLDVHSGRVARKLGLLTRRQNDAKALCELDCTLRTLDPKDPVKYDFALFGLGVHEEEW
ncbi:TIGR02757 family protein [Flavobacteriaceae bacterium F08102]|nr:TIGR02757 family protein [Flavobacteriaceae bacterium F08102]